MSNHGRQVTGLPHSNRAPSAEESYRIELIRKSIHFSSILIPVLYFYTPQGPALAILLPVASAFLIVDLARYYHRPTGIWFNHTFGRLLRSHETDRKHKRLNGASNLLLAASLAVLLFPKIVAVTSFMIVIISDTIAALVGKRFGRHPLFHKSWEGTSAFFLSAIVIISALPKIEYRWEEYCIGVFAAAAGTVVESLPIDIADNLSVPFTIGFTLWAGYAIVLPTINIYKFV